MGDVIVASCDFEDTDYEYHADYPIPASTRRYHAIIELKDDHYTDEQNCFACNNPTYHGWGGAYHYDISRGDLTEREIKKRSGEDV